MGPASDTKILLIMVVAVFFSGILSSSAVLSREETIRLATDPWSPYFSPELTNDGYLAEIVKRAFQRAGYRCVIEYIPWKRALELAKTGAFHGLLGAFYSEERAKYLEYSNPVGKSRMVFFSRKGANIHYDYLTDLVSYKIGYVHGYHYTDAFDAADYLSKVKSYNTAHNVKLLLNNRLDLLIGSEKVVFDILKNKFPNEITALEVVYPPLVTNKLYVPISKEIEGHKHIVYRFNVGLGQIKSNGIVQEIMEKHGYQE